MFLLLIWIPYERKLNQTIFESKRILSIIPKEILSEIPGIKGILGLNEIYIKTQNNDIQ